MGQANLDSLRDVWLDQTLHDTIRFDARIDIILDEYLFSQPDSAFYMAQSLNDSLLTYGNTKVLAYTYNAMGAAMLVKGNYNEALEWLQLSYETFYSLGYERNAMDV